MCFISKNHFKCIIQLLCFYSGYCYIGSGVNFNKSAEWDGSSSQGTIHKNIHTQRTIQHLKTKPMWTQMYRNSTMKPYLSSWKSIHEHVMQVGFLFCFSISILENFCKLYIEESLLKTAVYVFMYGVLDSFSVTQSVFAFLDVQV